MPDASRKTISASQVAGLFNKGRLTRWMLHQWAAAGADIDPGEDARMSWGKKMEPLILEEAAEHLKLEVHPNRLGYVLIDEPRLGCTVDATTVCPSRGRGVVETKVCFDWLQWRDRWATGEAPPEDYELQLQAQMMVTGAEWGVIVVWFQGELHYFERRPEEKIQALITAEVTRFWDDVEAGREPDAFGVEVEMPIIRQLWPTKTFKLYAAEEPTLRDRIIETIRQYDYFSEQAAFNAKAADSNRIMLVSLARLIGADKITAGAYGFKAKASSNGAIRLTTYQPAEEPKG